MTNLRLSSFLPGGRVDLPCRSIDRLFITLCLAVVVGAYHGRGYYHMVLESEPNLCDLRARWEEEQCILRGYTRRANLGHPITAPDDELGILFTNDGKVTSKARLPSWGGYPPWAFFTGLFFFSANWPNTRILFASVNLVATAIIGRWAYTQGRISGKIDAWLAVCAALAINGFCNTLVVGQYGILVVAAVIAADYAERRHRPLLSGILLGVAMTKPTVAVPLMLPFILRHAWQSLLVATTYLFAATGVVYVMTQANPLDMCLALLRSGAYAAGDDDGVARVLLVQGVDPNSLLPILAVCGLGIGTVVMFKLRHLGSETLFAVACVLGRVCTYHRKYDNVMLVFLLVSLSVAACRPNSGFLVRITFLACGLSLWLPVRFVSAPAVQTVQIGIWVLSCVVFVAHARRLRVTTS